MRIDEPRAERSGTRGFAVRRRKIGLACGLVACVAVVLLSPSFGRAQPSGAYRPPLPPDALHNGCYPLPAGVHLDLRYQVRHDGDVRGPDGLRRRLVLQYDLVDLDTAAAAFTRSFVAAGFHEHSGSIPDGVAPTGRTITLVKSGVGPVRATLTPLSPSGPDQIVRGSIVLDLPVAARASASPVCSDPSSTKRFGREGSR
ncbi:MAG TPA: hypothetical protein VN088_19600 [Nocardioides sp.]|nr:hypothetical protein [Nocardioides sp.]